MHAIVIGGGIGGLASAVALARRGWTVELVERQPDLTAAGAALLLWPNALHALRALDLGAAVEAVGQTMRFGGGRTPSGRWLTTFDAGRVAERLGAPIVAVHRADLHEILAAALPPTVTVHTGQTVTSVAHLDADLIVGADGLGSVVRAACAPEVRFRDSGQVAWRAVVDVPGSTLTRFGETFGRGWRFGGAPLGAHGVYWFVTAPGPLRTTSSAEQLAELRTALAGWHAPIPELLAATPPERLLHHALVDLQPVAPMAFDGRVALVGDAAHAMTPNLGQGACLALEDAVVLAATLEDGVPAGLARYDALRRPRAARIVASSWRMGRVAGARGWLACHVRDLLMWVMPDRLTELSAAAAADWRPPLPTRGETVPA
jgi:2-polyprenyl-6-methoxyphenol hydroxylase-like FAD-dependent oxidoreductase